MSNHAYKDYALDYINKGLSVIPGKRGSKMPAIKEWSKYCNESVNENDALTWINTFTETNIDLCLGSASNIVALDFDCEDPQIIEIIEPLMPGSPVEKKGLKGFTRFFRYTGEHNSAVKFNGKVVFEILSTGKKTTMPGSQHPCGKIYEWTSDKTILDINVNDLPLLPPMLVEHAGSLLRARFPSTESQTSGKLINGRNDALSSLCGSLIREGKTVDEAVSELVKFDRKNHEQPLFTDADEMLCTEPFTNALLFYSNHLTTVNNRHMKKSEEYEVPVTASAVNDTYVREIMGKQKPLKESSERKSAPLPKPEGVLYNIQQYILANSFIKQPELALSAAIGLMGTLIQRKVVFSNNSANMYLLNVSPSGSGKDAPQQCIKRVLIDIGATSLLGRGDYVSDASLVDGLAANPSRIDIIDEASGLLRSVNKGGDSYNGKMADILCELFSCSNSKYLGRETAMGTKGAANRPNVSLLMSTTPRGFSQSVNYTAIEKGLLGRTLIFNGDPSQKAERLKDFPELSAESLERLRWWAAFTPPSSQEKSFGVYRDYVVLEESETASNALDHIFSQIDNLRRNTPHDSLELPIISRLYQHMCKIAMIHACSRACNEIPKIEPTDVKFAYKLVMYCFENFKVALSDNINNSDWEAGLGSIISFIKQMGGIVTKRELFNKFKSIPKKKRKDLLADLQESGILIPDMRSTKEGSEQIYRMLVDEYEN